MYWDYTREEIDKLKELKRQWVSHRKIKEKLHEEFWRSPWLGSISRWTQDMEELQDKIDELSNSIKEKPKYEYDDENLFVYTTKLNEYWEKEKIRFDIPFSILNEIQRCYVSKGKWWTQQEIIDHNWWTNKEPLYIDDKARNALKSALDLTKKSWITNKIFMKILDDKYWEEYLEEYIEKRALSTERQKHKELALKKHQRAKDKLYKKAMENYGSVQNVIQIIKDIVREVEPRPINFEIQKPENIDVARVKIADMHYWRTSNIVRQRIQRILGDIKQMSEDYIEIMLFWDEWETIITEGMHNWQILEMDVLGKQQMMDVIEIIVEFVLEIIKMGKKVSIYWVSESNHVRTSKDRKGDAQRILWTMFYEVLRARLHNFDVEIDYTDSIIWVVDKDHLRYICFHWDEWLNKKKAETILFWDQWSKHEELTINRFKEWQTHMIVSAHYHTFRLEQLPRWYRMFLPSINDSSAYERNKFMRTSEPWYVICKPTKNSTDIIFKSLA